MSTWIRFFSRTTTLWGEKGEEGRREEKEEERRREEKGEEGRREEKGEGRREEREDREGEKGRGEIEMCNGRGGGGCRWDGGGQGSPYPKTQAVCRRYPGPNKHDVLSTKQLVQHLLQGFISTKVDCSVLVQLFLCVFGWLPLGSLLF